MNAGPAILSEQQLRGCLLAAAFGRNRPETLVLGGVIFLVFGLLLLLFPERVSRAYGYLRIWPHELTVPRLWVMACGIACVLGGGIFVVAGIWRWLAP